MTKAFKDILTLKIKKHGEKKIVLYSITNEGIIPRSDKYNIELSEDYSNNKIINYGDIIFGNSRHTLNYGVFLENDIGSVSSAYHVFEINQDIITPEYLHYYMLHHRKDMLHILKPGARDNRPIDREMLFNTSIKVPTLEVQNIITKRLNLIDRIINEKIEIINKLEELLKTLYDRWFVSFEFPDDKGNPYKSSGGKFIKSKLGDIPQNWSVLKLDKHLNFERGIEPGADNYEDEKTSSNIPFYRVGDMHDDSKIKYIDPLLVKDKFVYPNDILVSFDGAIGRVTTGISGSYSTGMRKISSKNHIFTNQFIYVLFKSDLIQTILSQHANGTTILHASSSIKYLETIYDKEVIEKFTKIISPIVDKIIHFKEENIELNRIKNLLLASFMSDDKK